MEPTSNLLNLAAGGQAHPDWTNVDWFPARVRYNVRALGPLLRTLQEGRASYTAASGAEVRIFDLSRGVPFDDSTFDVVYHSNFLEHLDRPDARLFLRECRRVLRPGGVTRVVVPDLELRAHAYLESISALRARVDGAERRHEFAVLDLLDQMVRTESGGEIAAWLNAGWPDRENPPLSKAPAPEGSLRFRVGRRIVGPRQASDTGELHRWMYDRESLARELVAAGFQPPAFTTYDRSLIAGWERYRLDEAPGGGPLHHDCLYAEARA